MNKLFELFVRYINKKSGVWRGVMTALSAVIVFATTYALILPAITLDSGTAYEEPGIEVEEGEIFIEDEFDGYEAEPQETGEPDDAIFFEDEESEWYDGDFQTADDMEMADGIEPEPFFTDDEEITADDDTVLFDDDDPLLTDDADDGAGIFMILREGSDGNYYAMSSEGRAVYVEYDAAENIAYYSGDAEVLWTRDGNSFSNNGVFLDVTAAAVGGRAISDELCDVTVNPVEGGRTSLYTTENTGSEEEPVYFYNCLVLSEDEGSFTVIRIDTPPVNRVILARAYDAQEETASEDDLFVDEVYEESAEEETPADPVTGIEAESVEEGTTDTEEAADEETEVETESAVEEVVDAEEEEAAAEAVSDVEETESVAEEVAESVAEEVADTEDSESVVEEVADADETESVAEEVAEAEEISLEDAVDEGPDTMSTTESVVEEMAEVPSDSDACSTVESAVEEIADPFAPVSGELTYEGDDYTITVNYDETAGIPEGAELKVSEILPGTAEYDSYYEKAAGAVSGNGEAKPIGYARFFDISFIVQENGWFGATSEREIEPETGVSVIINYRTVASEGAEASDEIPDEDAAVSVPENTQEMAPQLSEDAAELNVVHFTEGDAQIIDGVDAVQIAEDEAAVSFQTESFSVYGLVYTVDFHWEANGKTYDFSIPGGGFVSFYNLVEVLGIAINDANTEKDEIRELVDGVAGIEFSNPELVSVSKVEEDTTVGAIKERLGLECEYSAELTEEQIAEINAQEAKAGDWALISLKPFDTEETLTITMKNGDQWTVKVTDENVNVDASFDGTEGYIIYTIGKDGKYYALNNQSGNNYELSGGKSDLDTLGNDFKWTIEFVYQEKGQGYYDNSFDIGYNYYKVRSYVDRSRYLFVGTDTQAAIVKNEATNVHIIPNPNGPAGAYAIGGRFDLFGAHWMTALASYDTGYLYSYPANQYEFEPKDKYAPFFIYRQPRTSYEFTVQTEDIRKGSVSGKNISGEDKTNEGLFTTKTNATDNDANKTNLYPITATPTTNRLRFDHWTLNDTELDSEQYGATIPAGGLIIPGNGAVLEAHFVKNPDYEPTDQEKEGRDAIDKATFDAWLNELIQNQQPLVEDACNKTAEVYDYENRIYRVDLTAESNLSIFDGEIDLGFIIDVSASMKFPSKLINATDVVNNTVAKDITKINNNGSNRQPNWKNWGLNTNKSYYVIADPDSTSTVCRLFWNGSKWMMHDASKNQGSDDFDPAISKGEYWKDGKNKTLLIKEASDLVTGQETGTIAQVIREKGLQVGQPKTRAVYLEASIKDAIAEMYSIKQRLSVAADGSNDYQPKIAYNQFCGYIYDAQLGFVPAPQNGNVVTGYSYDGGTSTDVALLNAAGYVRSDVGAGNAYERDKNASGFNSHWNREWGAHSYSTGTGRDSGFQWDENSTKRYAILITDGAPQRSSKDIDGRYLTEAADKLRSKDVKLVSVGLSMKDVAKGSGLLYSISDEDELGVPYYYKAESGDKLSNVIYETLQDTIGSAIVSGNVTDTIGQAFYPVDKKTGNPLEQGDWINLNGEKVDSTYTGKHGVINVSRALKNGKMEDVYTVTWDGQDIKTHENGGWHGTVYIKAKEDLIGGNGVQTNDGKAAIQATHFRNREDADPVELKQDLKARKELDTPLVNINELGITRNNTEWTVYVGEEVNPLDELQKLYDQMEVIQVISGGTDRNSDGLIDKVSADTSAPDSGNSNMYYPLPTTINEMESDSREAQGSGERLTFKLKDLIKSLTGSDTLDWEKLLSEAEKTGTDQEHPEEMNQGIEIPYHPYGINDDSKLIIKLTKQIAEGEPDISKLPHKTQVVGDGVEKYTLTVYYEPDYKVLPTGQYGEADIATYHVGTYESQSQGNATGREIRENQHIINVYAKSLDILKLYDETDKNSVVKGAVFKLYRAKKGEESVDDAELLSKYGLSGMHCIDTQTTDKDGIAKMAAASAGDKAPDLLNAVDGPYYLIEYSAPAGYKKDETLRTITVTTSDNIFKDVNGNAISEADFDDETQKPKTAYNWEQGVKFQMTGGTVIIADPQTHEVKALSNGRTYALKEDDIVFQTEVINLKSTDISIKKVDGDGTTGLAGAVFELKVEKSGAGVYVKTDDEYKDIGGVEETVTKTVDGKTKTYQSAFETTGDIQNLTGLPDGTYILTEAYVPAGYINSIGEIRFSIENGTMELLSENSKLHFDPPSDGETPTLALLTITNEPGAALPNTGGSGTNLFYLLGFVLAGFALSGMVMKKQRREAA